MNIIHPLSLCNGGASEGKIRPAPPRNESYVWVDCDSLYCRLLSTMVCSEPNFTNMSPKTAPWESRKSKWWGKLLANYRIMVPLNFFPLGFCFWVTQHRKSTPPKSTPTSPIMVTEIYKDIIFSGIKEIRIVFIHYSLLFTCYYKQSCFFYITSICIIHLTILITARLAY